MGSFVQARYVHWRTVGKCSIHKNTLVVVQLFVKVQYSYLIQFLRERERDERERERERERETVLV